MCGTLLIWFKSAEIFAVKVKVFGIKFSTAESVKIVFLRQEVKRFESICCLLLCRSFEIHLRQEGKSLRASSARENIKRWNWRLIVKLCSFKARSKKVWKHRQREYQTVNLEGLFIFNTDELSLVVKLSNTVIRGKEFLNLACGWNQYRNDVKDLCWKLVKNSTSQKY